MDDLSSGSLTEDDLESIIDRLDLPDGGFPADAIEEARRRSQEITPLLIGLIQDAKHGPRFMMRYRFQATSRMNYSEMQSRKTLAVSLRPS